MPDSASSVSALMIHDVTGEGAHSMNQQRRGLRRLTIAVVTMTALFGAGSSPAWAKSGPDSPASVVYLSVTASGEDQCAKPLTGRVGNWVCYTTPSGTAQLARRASVTPLATTTYCNASGCYGRYDDFHADFDSADGTFGYGSKVLGTEHHYVNWQLTGAAMVAKPAQMYTSINTTSLLFTGSLLNAAPNATGSVVAGTSATYSAGNAAAYQAKAWLPNGYKSYDNTMWDHSQALEFTWNVPGYGGYWYAYVKSVSSHTSARGSGAIYRFRALPGLPASPYGSGWHS